MKKILGYTILFLFLSTGARAQDFDLGDIMGEAQEFFGEAQDEAKQASDNKAIDDFKEKFKDKLKKLGDFSGYLDNFSAETKCAYMIFKYKMEMDSLIAKTNAAENCRKKYDLYGMQLIAMTSSTTIMYCSEGLYNLLFSTDNSEEEQKKVNQLTTEITEIVTVGAKKFMAWSYDRGDAPNDVEKTFIMIYQNAYELADDSSYQQKEDEVTSEIMQALGIYFHPASLLRNTISISEEMDKLKPCAEHQN